MSRYGRPFFLVSPPQVLFFVWACYIAEKLLPRLFDDMLLQSSGKSLSPFSFLAAFSTTSFPSGAAIFRKTFPLLTPPFPPAKARMAVCFPTIRNFGSQLGFLFPLIFLSGCFPLLSQVSLPSFLVGQFPVNTVFPSQPHLRLPHRCPKPS